MQSGLLWITEDKRVLKRGVELATRRTKKLRSWGVGGDKELRKLIIQLDERKGGLNQRGSKAEGGWVQKKAQVCVARGETQSLRQGGGGQLG